MKLNNTIPQQISVLCNWLPVSRRTWSFGRPGFGCASWRNLNNELRICLRCYITYAKVPWKGLSSYTLRPFVSVRQRVFSVIWYASSTVLSNVNTEMQSKRLTAEFASCSTMTNRYLCLLRPMTTEVVLFCGLAEVFY
jgi:hypothetical protein